MSKNPYKRAAMVLVEESIAHVQTLRRLRAAAGQPVTMPATLALETAVDNVLTERAHPTATEYDWSRFEGYEEGANDVREELIALRDACRLACARLRVEVAELNHLNCRKNYSDRPYHWTEKLLQQAQERLARARKVLARLENRDAQK